MEEEKKSAQEAGGSEEWKDQIHDQFISVSKQHLAQLTIEDDRAPSFHCGMRK